MKSHHIFQVNSFLQGLPFAALGLADEDIEKSLNPATEALEVEDFDIPFAVPFSNKFEKDPGR